MLPGAALRLFAPYRPAWDQNGMCTRGDFGRDLVEMRPFRPDRAGGPNPCGPRGRSLRVCDLIMRLFDEFALSASDDTMYRALKGLELLACERPDRRPTSRTLQVESTTGPGPRPRGRPHRKHRSIACVARARRGDASIFWRVVELGRHARGWYGDETLRPLLFEPDHPVPQRLAVHPAYPPAMPRRAQPQSRTTSALARCRPRSSQTREPRRPNNPAAQELLGPWQPPPFAIPIVLQPIRESLEAEPIGGLILEEFSGGLTSTRNAAKTVEMWRPGYSYAQSDCNNDFHQHIIAQRFVLVARFQSNYVR
jgi:hypothetical protein